MCVFFSRILVVVCPTLLICWKLVRFKSSALQVNAANTAKFLYFKIHFFLTRKCLNLVLLLNWNFFFFYCAGFYSWVDPLFQNSFDLAFNLKSFLCFYFRDVKDALFEESFSFERLMNANTWDRRESNF